MEPQNKDTLILSFTGRLCLEDSLSFYTYLFHIAYVILFQRIQSDKLETFSNHIKWLVQRFCHYSNLVGPNLKGLLLLLEVVIKY